MKPGYGLAGSGEYAALLLRRAQSMLEGAEWRLGRGEYDLACFEAEQAAQLALKHLVYILEGSIPRTHSLAELLGVIYRFLSNAGLEDTAGLVAEFASSNRRKLWLLEDAYYKARYGHVEYSVGDAEECLSLARSVLALVEEVKRRLGLS